MNIKALFSDGTCDYRSPMEPEKNESVTLRFRTAAAETPEETAQVWLCDDSGEYEMSRTETGDGFDYYQIKKQLGEQKYQYFFKICMNGEVCLYDRLGVKFPERQDQSGSYRNVGEQDRSLEKFAIVPGFSTPDWAKGAVMYQILVDRFCNGDPSNDVLDREYFYTGVQVSKPRLWEKYPSEKTFAEFYGGDLEGVRQKLDYLQDLGIEVLYFNPLFVSPSSHKYDTQDYEHIDPHYGKIVNDGGELLEPDCMDNRRAEKYIRRVTDPENLKASDELFCTLVREAHERGMKVILDGVFNHCGSFNRWLDREKIYETGVGNGTNPEYVPGAYEHPDSPYREYFSFRENTEEYEGWWDYDTLPKLNYDCSEKLCRNILEVAGKWVSPPYSADGWRLDVAADLGHCAGVNHKFWQDFRQTVKKANPKALILAEHYGDPESWLQGDQWDTIMNYDAFMEPVTWFLTGMEKHSDEYEPEAVGNIDNFRRAMNHGIVKMMTPSLLCSMNELSNHDHSRFLTRTNHKVGRAEHLGAKQASESIDKSVFRAAVVMQMTWQGAPTVYYGDEAGVCGFTDPDNRRTYPWGQEDRELIAFHKDIIRIHRENEALKTGSMCPLYGEKYILAYGRFNRREQLVIAVNGGETAKSVVISVCPAGIAGDCQMEQLMYANGAGYSTRRVCYEVKNGMLDISLPGKSALVLRRLY